MARRICTIVSNVETRNDRLKELKEILIERKYPISLIDHGIERATGIDIEELRTTKDKSVRFNPQSTKYRSVQHNTSEYTTIKERS